MTTEQQLMRDVLNAAVTATWALAHACEKDPSYQKAYDALSELTQKLRAALSLPEQQAPQPDPLERVTRLSEEMGLYPWQQAPQIPGLQHICTVDLDAVRRKALEDARTVLVASPAAPDGGQLTPDTTIADAYMMGLADGVGVKQGAEQPSGERAELIERLRWFVNNTNNPAEEYIAKASALLAADAKVGAEPVAGLIVCDFDDGCEFCGNPEGRIFTRLIHNPEDCTEAEFYICEKCVYDALQRYTHPPAAQKPLTDEEIDGVNMRTELPDGSISNIGHRQWRALFRVVFRAAERAHGITGKEQP